MQIKDIKIGSTLYYIGNYEGMISLYGQSGTVKSVDEEKNTVALLMIIHPGASGVGVHLSPDDVSLEKPLTLAQAMDRIAVLECETHNQKGDIELLREQARVRSRQLDQTKELADKRMFDIEHLNTKLKQAERQILRHEDSLKTVRESNELLRGTNEMLIEKNANLERGLSASDAALEAAQKFNDSLAQEVVHLRSMSSNTEDSVSKTISEKDSIITSLRSQIESLQSIVESQKGTPPFPQELPVSARLGKIERFLSDQFESFK